jgi:NitT/TauT family transport system substrate-binding protein
MLADPDTPFPSTPVGIMQFVEFMSLANTIKTRLKTWSELFVDNVKARKGS